MCGIAGIMAPAGGSELAGCVERMISKLVHRGPDDVGIWSDEGGHLSLGHRRLSILDLSPQGHQPMCSASGRYVLAFNGEIYNFGELRRELEAGDCAPQWRGHSDTEIFLAAVEAWGVEMSLKRCRGMFAMALWDRDSCTLNLIRDRTGEKPLYYGMIEGRFLFASELKALIPAAANGLQICRDALSAQMRFGYVPAPRSIYQGISKLPAGHYLAVTSAGEVCTLCQYWSPQSSEIFALRDELEGKGDDELIGLVDQTLRESVRLQTVADVPLGAFLSGGVDSSTVVALMAAQATRKIRTYTIGFNEREFDEAPYARAIASHLGTDHTELYVSASDAAAVIPQLSTIYDEPFADSSQIPSILVSRMTRQHVTVALSGDGGDELFEGYPRYAITANLWRRTRTFPLALRRPFAAMLQSVSAQGWDGLFAILPESQRGRVNGRRMHRLAQLIVSGSLGEMYERLMTQWQPEDELVLGASTAFSLSQDWPLSSDDIGMIRRWDFLQHLPDDLLVKVDRAAMSASLETRAPLLDRRVVELAFALPKRMLVRDGVGKWVLRRVLDRYVPRELIDRPKAGFSIPLAEWLRGPLRGWAEDLLCPANIRSQGLLDAEKVTKIWEQHVSGVFDRSLYIWNVLMFQAWLTGTKSREMHIGPPREERVGA